jgi:hypothetical protein
VRANARADKTPVLLELREELESLKAMLRLAYDAKAIAGIASFEHGARLLVDIARQNEGWLKSQTSRAEGSGASERAAAAEGDARPPAGRPGVQGRGQNRSDAFTRRALARGWSVAIAHEGHWRGRRAGRSREIQQVLLPA